MDKRKKKEDIFTFISRCIQDLYKKCHENGVGLSIIKIEAESAFSRVADENYLFTQLVWEKSETYEILEALKQGSKYYKGDPITKNDIIDLMIELGLSEKKKKTKKGEPKKRKR